MKTHPMETLFETLDDSDVDTTLLRSAWIDHNEKPDNLDLADRFRRLRTHAIREMHTNKAVKDWVRSSSAWERMENRNKARAAAR